MQIDEARCHHARAEKDHGFDGLFFAGVVTTGIYCRTVCPAPRPPNRENVRFFPSAAAAERAGFRACRLCHPERAAGIGVWSGVPAVVSRALNLIGDGALDGEEGVDDLARRVGVSARQLRRLFDEHLGASPLAIAKARRVHFARRLLDDTDLPIARVALAAGFNSIRQFNNDVKRTFGRSPSELRRGSRRSDADDEWVSVRLPYRPPLDWPRMVGFLRGRAITGVEVAEHDRYRRTVQIGGEPAEIEVQVVADQPYLLLRVRSAHDARLIEVARRADRIFDLGANPVAIAEGLGESASLAPFVRRRPGNRIPGAWDGFEIAVRAILGQQVSVRRANGLAARLVAEFGEPYEGGEGLTHLFPTAETLAEADVRAIGVTGAQATSISALAAAVAAGELTIEAPRGLEEFVGRMCALPGIGPWTAHYIAMRACGEADAFPASDLGLRRALGNGKPLSEKELQRVAEEWRPWRAYAAMYLWSSDSNATPTRSRKPKKALEAV